MQTARIPGDAMLSFITEAETLAENADELHTSEQPLFNELARQQKLFMSNMIHAASNTSSSSTNEQRS